MDQPTQNEALFAWEANARFWDAQMGDASNRFHREVVRPGVTQLLAPQAGERILDIACGNGNYAAFLAQRGVQIVACDFSETLLACARRRHAHPGIEYRLCDVTDPAALRTLRRQPPYDKAVSLMALMDISELTPLFAALRELLAPGGCFVFATQHPCFVTLTEQYLTPHSYLGEAIAGQPQLQHYYHRSLQDLFGLCFSGGFVIDGLLEVPYGNPERPEVLIVRARKAE